MIARELKLMERSLAITQLRKIEAQLMLIAERLWSHNMQDASLHAYDSLGKTQVTIKTLLDEEQ